MKGIQPKTRKALKLVAQGHTRYRAAQLAGVSESTVQRALERQDQRCPHCGQVMTKSPA